MLWSSQEVRKNETTRDENERQGEKQSLTFDDFLVLFSLAPYLDVVRDIKNAHDIPIAIYHVSGEYAMLWHAAAAGAFGLAEGVVESLMNAKRAGANILITYFTPFLLKRIREQQAKHQAAAEQAAKGEQ